LISLYEISEEFNKLEDLILESGGEISEEQEELVAYFENLLTTKTDNMVQFVQKLEDEIDLADKHIKRLNAYKQARKAAIERLKTYTADCMKKLSKTNLKGDLCEIKLRTPLKKVEIYDESKIPSHFIKTTYSVSADAVKKVLNEGVEVSGARLVDGKISVQFKSKGGK
jgi:hypothetical protein